MQSAADEVLLINDVGGGESDLVTDDLVLVKKAVMICKKHSAEKFSIHRLRAEEPEKSREKLRGQKRSRDNRAKEPVSAPLRYIERIKLGARERGGGSGVDEGTVGAGRSPSIPTVSHSHLSHLTNSLERRLESGIRELDRLTAVVASKHGMVQRLDAFVTDEWWRSQETVDANELPLKPLPRGGAPLAGVSEPEIAMQTLIPGPDSGRAEPVQHLPLFMLKPLVSLVRFDVLEFVPALSLVRIEVVLRNASTRSFHDGFVTLVSDARNELQSSSSVHASMQCVAQDGAGLSSFVLEVRLSASFSVLRLRSTIQASVWLHCSTRERSRGDQCAGVDGREALVPPSDCSLVVGVVEIDLHEAVVTHSRPRRASVQAGGAYVSIYSIGARCEAFAGDRLTLTPHLYYVTTQKWSRSSFSRPARISHVCFSLKAARRSDCRVVSCQHKRCSP